MTYRKFVKTLRPSFDIEKQVWKQVISVSLHAFEFLYYLSMTEVGLVGTVDQKLKTMFTCCHVLPPAYSGAELSSSGLPL